VGYNSFAQGIIPESPIPVFAGASLINQPPRQNDFTPLPRRILWYLITFLAVAFFLRMVVFLSFPSIYWADEIFQTQEAAHRLTYGVGVITWEFRLGARSWVLPAVIAGLMKSTAWLGSGSSGYIFATAFFFSLLSLTVVWFAFSWCRQYFGMQYALLAGFTTTMWYELVHFGARSLNELVASHLFLPAIYLGSLKPDQKPESKWRLLLIGMLLGLTVCLRMQFGPAVLVVGLWILSRDWKVRFLPVSFGILIVVMIFGTVDAITWSVPFYSYYAYFRENIIHHRAAGFGVLPWYYYLSALFIHTGPLPIFALMGLRRSPILGWVCLAVLFPHLLVAHKEFRYIYPVLPLLLTLAAIGQIDFLQFLERKTKGQLSPQERLLIAASFVLACSLALASQFPRWDKARGGIRAFSRLSLDSQACGVAVVKVHWWDTGGYTYLHRPIPIFIFSNISDAESVTQTFNRVVAPESTGVPVQGYSPFSCRDGVCVYRREGSCQAGGAEYQINEILKQED
jgi:phosphatidylinositol glycan class B